MENGASGSFIESTYWDAEPRPDPGSETERGIQNPDELRREIEALRDRISKLSVAILRISVSLDVRSLLQEVVERLGVIPHSAPGLREAMSSSPVADSVPGQN